MSLGSATADDSGSFSLLFSKVDLQLWNKVLLGSALLLRVESESWRIFYIK
jgi:hypothetical protein